MLLLIHHKNNKYEVLKNTDGEECVELKLKKIIDSINNNKKKIIICDDKKKMIDFAFYLQESQELVTNYPKKVCVSNQKLYHDFDN